MRIIAIDFEASCLPRHGKSYPIEVGISADGQTAQSWLIRPAPSWSGWDWTEEAESLHGLSRDQIDRDGLPAREVAKALADAVADAGVVADSALDDLWFRTLCEAAGVPAFTRVRTVAELFDAHGFASETIFDALHRVDAIGLHRHRAGDDARWLAALLAELDLTSPLARSIFAWPPASQVAAFPAGPALAA